MPGRGGHVTITRKVCLGEPAFGVAREQGGWELHPYFGVLALQDARDSRGSHFRRLAQAEEQSGDLAGLSSACGRRSGWTGRSSTR
jgi:hypothetical protein